ncbi:hypothetical protein [Streptomyces sp. HF10]|uniref:hypothetical protein n=1 Tax=Streptomyces sp. HF10 TaxID=2692233 RepID=UPI001317B028|nr:hypothetical protein [Streptomyces sp. HF10]QHC33051.1 hypothetical protein GR129_34130 [Streptomyces sp. HF10]
MEHKVGVVSSRVPGYESSTAVGLNGPGRTVTARGTARLRTRERDDMTEGGTT